VLAVAVLVEQRQPSVLLKYALDDEHDIGATGVELVEDQRNRVLQCPRQHAFDKLGDLRAVTHHDCVAPDEIHAADMPIEVHPNSRPIQPSSDLLNMG